MVGCTWSDVVVDLRIEMWPWLVGLIELKLAIAISPLTLPATPHPLRFVIKVNTSFSVQPLPGYQARNPQRLFPIA
jgi:hypothetical protein